MRAVKILPKLSGSQTGVQGPAGGPPEASGGTAVKRGLVLFHLLAAFLLQQRDFLINPSAFQHFKDH